YIADYDDWLGELYYGYHANKLGWLSTYDWVSGSGSSAYISTQDAPNTTSSLLEASRLAQIYRDLQAGDAPTSATLHGYYMAFGYPHPYTIPFTADAILAKIHEIFEAGIRTDTPIALDLNHDGHIGVTGKSTAAVRKKGNGFVRKGSVLFDLAGYGKKGRFEWLNGDGDGFLVYDKGGAIERAMQHGGYVDGKILFGNAIGYDNGFQKLAVLTSKSEVASKDLQGLPTKQASAATGAGLKDLKVWINRHRDGRVHPGELYSLASLGITEVSLVPKMIQNRYGEIRVVSSFVQHGKRYLMEDVYFAEDPADGKGRRR
ncbi:MAG: hypothetical protein KGR26_12270, partial [Cyanobacteria bacterium REEB65]|nr:hypothetical protein [Cyanobacteria bacterium REEB65]